MTAPFISDSAKRTGLKARSLRAFFAVDLWVHSEHILFTLDELKSRLVLTGYVITVVIAMSGWIYALGWVALKLIQFV
jgi:hypothetical protein